MLKRTWTAVLLAVLMVAAALPAVAADSGTAPESETSYEQTQFTDIAGNTFENAINWLVDQGITVGCNPPTYTNFCPGDPVTRGQMAVFITRALSLPAASDNYFDDDNGAFYENSANRLFEAGISVGCNPPANNNFCGGEEVTRAQMATFLNRGFGLAATNVDYFTDDNGSVHETSINRIRSANITVGCNPPVSDNFCPGDTVTRGQMSAFIKRAVEGLANPTAPPQPPGTTGPCDNTVLPDAECQALVNLYNNNNGANWTVTGWLSGDPCTPWEGVSCEAGHVVELDLENRNLSGSIPDLSALAQLKEINFAQNLLTGSIPPSLGNLANLEVLSLDGTQLSGSLQSALGNLSNLVDLDLADNPGLTQGALPTNWRNLGSLVTLDVSGTPVDAVPDWIDELTSLLDLDLAETMVTSLPDEIADLPALQRLDLSSTELMSVPNLTGLGDTLLLLDLADITSMPAGPIPPSVTSLTSLVDLYLNGSNFNGEIPADIGAIGAQLEILELAGNSLSGDLAATNIVDLDGLLLGGGLTLVQDGTCFTFSDGVPPAMPRPTYDFVEARTAAGEAAAITCP